MYMVVGYVPLSITDEFDPAQRVYKYRWWAVHMRWFMSVCVAIWRFDDRDFPPIRFEVYEYN